MNVAGPARRVGHAAVIRAPQRSHITRVNEYLHLGPSGPAGQAHQGNAPGHEEDRDQREHSGTWGRLEGP